MIALVAAPMAADPMFWISVLTSILVGYLLGLHDHAHDTPPPD